MPRNLSKDEKLIKIAITKFNKFYIDCNKEQQKVVLIAYFKEEEQLGCCKHCGTHNDVDVFNCTGCNAPLDNPLTSLFITSEFDNYIKVKGTGNIVMQEGAVGVKNSCEIDGEGNIVVQGAKNSQININR